MGSVRTKLETFVKKTPRRQASPFQYTQGAGWLAGKVILFAKLRKITKFLRGEPYKSYVTSYCILPHTLERQWCKKHGQDVGEEEQNNNPTFDL